MKKGRTNCFSLKNLENFNKKYYCWIDNKNINFGKMPCYMTLNTKTIWQFIWRAG